MSDRTKSENDAIYGLNRLKGKRAFVTQADAFMGPATCEHFRAEGAAVFESTEIFESTESVKREIETAGDIDILVANLASENLYGKTVEELDDDSFSRAFEAMVYPLHHLVRAVVPQMKKRGQGKIIVYGSAVPLRPMSRLAAYTAARGAQISYVKSVGVELARDNIQMNLIAQNWVENPAYYPEKMQENPKFQANLSRDVPLGRLARPEEDTALAVFLASSESDFFVGQAIPFSGGWAC
ncbi:SDR family oxidoreductase [Kordiimonas aquimaris]|uniref:SDR family oxidoreductase n=1 Tax=Kordiimonas aquimaris TaxID=707591 RepID=UPI0021D22701|nr:SDR family oxidoreductase [Kordiimonas aquimaris]